METQLTEHENNLIGWFDLPYEMRRIVIDHMNILTKIRFSQCSKDCYEEVGQSRNYVEIVKIYNGREEQNREIVLFVVTKDEKWQVQFYKPPSGCCRVRLFINGVCTWVKKLGRVDIIKVVLQYFNDILKNKTNSVTGIAICINDFPYHRSNIKHLNAKTMVKIDLSKNKYGITPIFGGFTDLHQLSRVQKLVGIANLPLNDLFKIKAKYTLLKKPDFSLDEFDEFLRRAFIEEDLDENVECISFNFKRNKLYKKDINYFLPIIQKYTTFSYWLRKRSGKWLEIHFWRTSENREHRLTYKRNSCHYRRTQEL